MGRRESRRLPVSLDAELIVNGYTYPVFIGNLSETGLHVFLSIPPGNVSKFEEHTSFDIKIHAESIGELTLSCKRLWSNELPGSPLVKKIGLILINPPEVYKKFYKTLFYRDRTEITKRPIAVIGMACYYPGAPTVRHLWENILARRREFRRIPDIRLPLAEYFDPDPTATDKTYGTKAAVIDGFEFDWIKRGIPKTVVESSDICHWLALETTLQALNDAGYGSYRKLPDRSGVILGNTLTGEHSRTENMRLRWPFVLKTLRAAANDTGLLPDIIAKLATSMEAYYKSVFAPITEDTLAGNLSNTIAGRICNFLNLNGGGYTVDGACSSSLIAVATAATALSHGNLDLAIVGGVDISLDTFELIGFAKTKALTPDDMRVYDRRANGFIPGEGAGFVVLKRLEDASADGNYIYAVLRGWALSSDGKGGITAPKAENQALAIQRAYTGSGYGVADVDFIEGHGTGTAVGDVAELTGIAQAMGNRVYTPIRPCGITSLKSIIGHTKAASGIGGFIKAVMAVNQRVIPPTANCSEPNQTFEKEARCLYPILHGEICSASEKLRAGISGMGFGGINCHVTIESGDAPASELTPTLRERQLLASGQETELFVISASSEAQLLERIQTVYRAGQGMSVGEMVDFAAQCSLQVKVDGFWRAAVIANSPKSLLDNLQYLEDRLSENPPAKGEKFIGPHKDVFLSHGMQSCKVGFLFPGQGVQQLNMGKVLVDRHEWAQEFIEKVSQWLKDVDGSDVIASIYRPLDRVLDQTQLDEWTMAIQETQIAQPAICLASLLWYKRLQRLGINPFAVGGHSLGELTAFHAAGAFDEETLLKLAVLRGQAMAATGGERGSMASLGCSHETASNILEHVDGYVIIANINGPRQVVISGEQQAVENVIAIAQKLQIDSRILRVSNAFHSKFVADASEHIRQKAQLPDVIGEFKVKLFTGLGGQEIKQNIDLRSHFAVQIISQVNFLSLIKNMVLECDLLLGVGPGNVINSLAQAVISKSGPPCLPTESKPGKDRDFNTFLAYYFIFGGNFQWKALYEDRLVRTFIPAQNRKFIENPCERTIKRTKFQAQNSNPTQNRIFPEILSEYSDIDTQILSEYFSKHSSFLKSEINADIKEAHFQIQSENEIALLEPSNLNDSKQEGDYLVQDSKVFNPKKSIATLLIDIIEEQTGFPKESLNMDMRLLDDLNLDSIKSGDILSNLAIELNVADEFNIIPYTNATIEDIAKALEDSLSKDYAHTSLSTFKKIPKYKTTWVRNMVSRAVEKKLEEKKLDSQKWKKAKFFIHCEQEEHLFAETFKNFLSIHGAEVNIIDYNESHFPELGNDDNTINHIAILPRIACIDEFNGDDLLQMINRLRSIAIPPPLKNRRKQSVNYIQFGGGYFGCKPIVAGVNQCATVSFAASLYYERPDLKIRVIDFDSRIAPDILVEKTLIEVTTTTNYAVVGYDQKLTRRVPTPEIHEPANYKVRDIKWNDSDVVLITGGAKGITAECGIAMAQATGARMALVGSSPCLEKTDTFESSNEVANMLKRYRKAGLTARYYQCDIVDSDAVTELISKIRSELGEITAFIHGSALNKPRGLQSVSPSDAFIEVAPKIMGAINICKALKKAPPKLIVGFSSIIGVTGMIRNSWYGFSNEALSLILSRFQQQHPQTSTQSIAYSLWADVGMGARLGSTNFFAKLGFDAIPVKEGVRRFLKLLLYDPMENQILVTARLPLLETFAPNKFPLPPSSRFLTKILYYYPGVEIVARTRLSLEKDPYLQDHNWRGTYLFPAVFGLEAMAQAVAQVTGESTLKMVRIENIQLARPISVNRVHGTEIEIRAVVLEHDENQTGRKIQVGITTEQTSFSIEHFSATFTINLKQNHLSENIDLPLTPLDIQTNEDIYNSRFLFQGPQFQRIKNIYTLDSKSCIFDSKLHDASSEYSEKKWLTGDPFFRDSLLHSAQLPTLQYISLPVSINRIDMINSNDDRSGLMAGKTVITDFTEDKIQCTVISTDNNGQVIEKIDGYVLKIMEYHHDYPTPEEIVNPEKRDAKIIEDEVKKCATPFNYIIPQFIVTHLPGHKHMSKEDRHRLELPALRKIAERCPGINRNQDIRFTWTDSGKPIAEGIDFNRFDISLSHDKGTLLSIAGQGRQGCDIESITSRSREKWSALLGKNRMLLIDELVYGSDSIDQAGTRIWAAIEASAKAIGSNNLVLKIEQRKRKSVFFRATDSNKTDTVVVLTFPVFLMRGPERIVAVTVKPAF